jgi:3-hydroxymyristoyl/3-hydroxydecanoyl-(acyl carrier protein) dehydratase
MIIQHYDFSIRCNGSLVFDGATYFGFFHPDALSKQAGMRNASPYELTASELSHARSFPLPDRSPLPDQRWRMVDRIDALVEHGGPHGLGVVLGSALVDAEAWYFQAHFLDDPVWPGSLGLESFLQLLKVVAVERWGCDQNANFDSPGLLHSHTWVYRGQILPSSRQVNAQAVVTARDDDRNCLKADGYLWVDDKVIYKLNDFTLRLNKQKTPGRGA